MPGGLDLYQPKVPLVPHGFGWIFRVDIKQHVPLFHQTKVIGNGWADFDDQGKVEFAGFRVNGGILPVLVANEDLVFDVI